MLTGGNDIVIIQKAAYAECLNSHFASIFTIENNNSFPLPHKQYPYMPSIAVTAPCVYKLLSSINSAKSVGPDGISPRILKEAANELTPVLTYLFNKLARNLSWGALLRPGGPKFEAEGRERGGVLGDGRSEPPPPAGGALWMHYEYEPRIASCGGKRPGNLGFLGGYRP